MGEYIGVDWAGKRWIVVIDADGNIVVDTQPSLQAVWDQYQEADQILVDIPIGLPDSPEISPRPCDEQAREVVSGSRYSSIFDVPCRAAIQASDHEIALQRNKEHIGDDSLGPQKWGFSERIHEADVFMRRTDTEGKFRESHPEVCFAALTPDGSTTTSKKSSLGQEDRLNVLQYHEPKFVQEFHRTRDLISEKPAWQRRVGVGMVDDIVDAMVLAYTARVGSLEGFTILGGETDSEDLPMEIVYYNGCTVMTDQ